MARFRSGNLASGFTDSFRAIASTRCAVTARVLHKKSGLGSRSQRIGRKSNASYHIDVNQAKSIIYALFCATAPA